tara:strand:+ start:1354 stop:1575 length:222 start_codon:yes stop_codon:yes gene_type:complete
MGRKVGWNKRLVQSRSKDSFQHDINELLAAAGAAMLQGVPLEEAVDMLEVPSRIKKKVRTELRKRVRKLGGPL